MVEAIPVYSWFDQVPTEPALRTRKQLAEEGLRPGGPIRARVVWRRGERWADLYAVAEAKPKKAPTAAQLAALEKAQERRRTCPGCKTVFPYVVGRYDDCPVCVEQEQALDRRGAAETAAAWLADPRAVVLDLETTDLSGRVVEIAVVNMQGGVLFDSLVNPLVPISEGARAIHRITDEMVAGAPTFAAIFEALCRVLRGRTVITYNVAFDRGVLEDEVYQLLRQLSGPWVDEAHQQAFAAAGYRMWSKGLRWRCAMEEYARWVGEWSEYWGNYRYQPLGGGHRALSDAQACLDVIRHMASNPQRQGVLDDRG